MKPRFIWLVMALLFFATSVSAVQLRIVDDDLTETRKYNEDYLFTGEYLKFMGEARDLFFFSREMTFSGKTDLAITGAARDVFIQGEVNNGVKAAAERVDIDGMVRGTSFLAGNDVTLGKNSQLMGDTFIGARKVTILGKQTGDLRVGAAEVSIQNVVEGDVTLYTGQLQIPEQGKIVGNLTYHSDHEISAEEAARVTGRVIFEKADHWFHKRDIDDAGIMPPVWAGVIFKVAFIIFGLLILLLPINRFLEGRFNRNSLLSHALWGLIPIFVYPSAFVVSILLLITLPMALVLLLAFLPVLFVTKVLGLTIIGGYLAERFNFSSKSRYLYFLLAAVPYSLLSFIPIFGMLLMVFVTAIGCGLLLSKVFNKNLT